MSGLLQAGRTLRAAPMMKKMMTSKATMSGLARGKSLGLFSGAAANCNGRVARHSLGAAYANVTGVRALSGGKHPEVTIGDETDLKKKLQPLAPQALDDVVKVELFQDKEAVEVSTIWNAYHAEKKSAVASTMSASEWQTFSSRLDQNPMFIFPVKKGDGAFFVLFAEWKENTMLLTFLQDYQRNPATAEPYFYVRAYPDFAQEKDLVLLRGEFLPYLTKPEAETLLNDVLEFYLKDSKKFDQVRIFNHQSHMFDFNAVFGL